MKKIISILLLLSLSMVCLCSCERSTRPIDGIYTDYDGVYLTIDSIDESGDYPVLNVTWHNETDQMVTFGLWYVVEYLDGDEWKNIQIADYAIPEIACMLAPGESGSQNYTTKYFNMLREGRYRVRTEFYIPELQVGTKNTWAEFELAYK